ncbi:MAG TPA: aldehyde dehydrogenase family protein [Acidobacteriaceae bacterium]|jgi:aldehyde dehydrogenase (NAD+)|nr:aldehyde dehydrogenase family protein [Acidobacteriaceae bacterium]
MDGCGVKPATIDAIPQTVERLGISFASGRTRPLPYRLEQLSRLDRFLKECEAEIGQAIHKDLGRSEIETRVIETSLIQRELAFAQERLSAWARPERVRSPWLLLPASARVVREPFGVVLIIGPWNYPLQLLLVPLIGALAAGNCAVIKPSELAPATSALLAAALPRYLDAACVQVVEGGIPEATALLRERFDSIFYTGNARSGRIVLEAAAQHLTPVTLELGGKCPCIVDRSANLKSSARRIVWGKLLNAGQVCVAPDYVLADETVAGRLLTHMGEAVKEFLGEQPRTSPDFARIVNQHHFRRLVRLLDGGGEIVIGGEACEEELYLAPTILTQTPPDAPVMQEEIFGPILPVLTVRNADEAMTFVNQREKPLAIYLFADDARVQRQVIHGTSSGAVAVNYPCVHLALPGLPFGGVGASGMGAYHGRASFETFSHRKAVFTKASWPDPSLAYPPLRRWKEQVIRRLM